MSRDRCAALVVILLAGCNAAEGVYGWCTIDARSSVSTPRTPGARLDPQCTYYPPGALIADSPFASLHNISLAMTGSVAETLLISVPVGFTSPDVGSVANNAGAGQAQMTWSTYAPASEYRTDADACGSLTVAGEWPSEIGEANRVELTFTNLDVPAAGRVLSGHLILDLSVQGTAPAGE